MITLPNMGLVKWNSISDFFSHEQLAANFTAIDEHNHTVGKGVQIPAGGLAPLSVETGNIQAGAFTASKLANNSIEEVKIKDGSVTSRKVKPTTSIITASEDLTLTSSYQDVPGASLTVVPAVASKLLVVAVFHCFVNPASSQTGAAIGSLKVDSEAEQTSVARCIGWAGSSALELDQTVTQVYALSLAAGSHTIKMRAYKDGYGVAGIVRKTNTQMLSLLVSS